MKKLFQFYQLLLLSLLLMMLFQCPGMHVSVVHANEIPVDDVDLDILVSNESAHIELVKADVHFNITASSHQPSFSVEFWAHHLFYNRNESKIILIAFPFGPSYYGEFPQADLFQVNVSNIPVSFIHLPKTPYNVYSNLPEDDIRKQYMGYRNDFFLFNATFAGEAETTIDVALSGEFSIGDNPESITFSYIVESAHCWGWQNLTEIVQFTTWGRHADFYHPSEYALVSEGERSGIAWTNYTWVFPNREDGIPLLYSAGCSVRFNNPKYSKSSSFGSFMLATFTLIIFSYYAKKKEKKKGELRQT
ncbi:MAG: hypothetical protein ACXACI_16410 [Candidatus Hodarchaeales archaeon]|jgi:hypothetical protein